MIDIGDDREGNRVNVDIARPPDGGNQRDDQHRDQRLQIGAGAGAARPNPPDDRQRAQLGQQQLFVVPAKQRLTKTGGDVQGGRETDRNHRQEQPAGDALQPWAKRHTNKMRHAAGAGEMSSERRKDNRNWKHQHDQHRPCPQAVIARHQCRQRRHGKYSCS